MKTLKCYNVLRYCGFRVGIGVLRLFSLLPLPLIYLISIIVGEMVFVFHRSRRQVTIRNLRACFTDKSDRQIRRMARKHFIVLVCAILASGIAWWASKRRLERLTRFRNKQVYDTLLSRGRNIILLAPHFAALEYGGVRLSCERPLVSMYQINQNPLLNASIKAYRSRFGLVQFSSKEPIRRMIRLIKEGKPFYYLPDQDPGRNKGVFVPFFQIPTATFPVLGKIAKLTDASVVPCMTRLLPWGRGYEVIFDQPLADFPLGDAEQDTMTMNRAIEALIEHAPEQYFWSHRRFKTRPPGDPDFYSRN